MRWSSAEFEAFAAGVEAQAAPAEHGLIVEELLALTQCCQRPPHIGEDGLRAWLGGVVATLLQHPGAAAVAAVQEWPRQPGGRWWPMARDLDELAQAFGARHREAEAAVREARHRRGASSQARNTLPTGRAAKFVERVATAHGEAYVQAWLRGGLNAQFGEDRIWLTGVGFDRLNRECGAIAHDLGVKLEPCAQVSALLARYCDANGL